MLELALSELSEIGAADQGEDDISWESLFDRGLDAESICCVDKNASMLGSDNGVDYGGEVVHVGQCLDAENDVVEGSILASGGVLGIAND